MELIIQYFISHPFICLPIPFECSRRNGERCRKNFLRASSHWGSHVSTGLYQPILRKNIQNNSTPTGKEWVKDPPWAKSDLNKQQNRGRWMMMGKRLLEWSKMVKNRPLKVHFWMAWVTFTKMIILVCKWSLPNRVPISNHLQNHAISVLAGIISDHLVAECTL